MFKRIFVRLILALAIAGWPAAAFCAGAAYRYSGNIQFDISKVPFSRYGSYLAISRIAAAEGTPEGVYLRTLHGEVAHPEVFRLELIRGRNPIAFQTQATPTLLRLKAPEGEVEICFGGPKVLRFRGQGVGLRLEAPQPAREYAYAQTYLYASQVDPAHWRVNSFSQRGNYLVSSLAGHLVVSAPWDGLRCTRVVMDFLPDEQTGKWEGALEEFKSVLLPHPVAESFDATRDSLQSEYQEWLKKMPEVPEEFGRAAELAAYVDWESVVEPEGRIRRPAMLMSKNWMTNVWSWDICFNAMALAEKDPELAWDQFLLPFDHQDAEGAFPDLYNDQTMEWNFTKPPIHGWALAWMMKHSSAIGHDRLQQIYQPLERWTDWYFKYRDDDHDGLPQYNHGNDSGWDNSTVFLLHPPVETPDLAAYLVVQMDVLSDVARKLGKNDDAARWKKRADELLARLMEKFWRGDHFVALQSGSHRVSTTGSLILYLPLVLTDRLPAEARSALIEGLTKKGRFLTENGLATESLRSRYYTPDGYWLGPIWAPSTMVITESLDALGDKTLANQLRLRFCKMVARSGMSENFDAVTGEGLRDPAYTWTSSVFLIMAHELLREDGPQ